MADALGLNGHGLNAGCFDQVKGHSALKHVALDGRGGGHGTTKKDTRFPAINYYNQWLLCYVNQLSVK